MARRERCLCAADGATVPTEVARGQSGHAGGARKRIAKCHTGAHVAAQTLMRQGRGPLYGGTILAPNFRSWPDADLRATSATAHNVPSLATGFGFTLPRSEIIREDSFFSEIPPFSPWPLHPSSHPSYNTPPCEASLMNSRKFPRGYLNGLLNVARAIWTRRDTGLSSAL